VPHAEPGQPPALTESGAPLLAEIAVRSGAAEVRNRQQAITITAGTKLQVDIAGTIGEPLPARWQIIRDGDFAQYATGVYTNGLSAWTEYTNLFDPTAPSEDQNGKVTIYRGCGPEMPAFCTAEQTSYIGQFHREGNQPKSFGKGLSQTLDVDVSEYRRLRLSLRARVVHQSIARAGQQNSECPVTIQLIYKQRSPSDQEETRYFCIYVEDTDTQLANSGEFIYQGVHQNDWSHLGYELRNIASLGTARYLQKINIYANGHDYISEVTDISLVGTQ
jgi:hypothetical protein